MSHWHSKKQSKLPCGVRWLSATRWLKQTKIIRHGKFSTKLLPQGSASLGANDIAAWTIFLGLSLSRSVCVCAHQIYSLLLMCIKHHYGFHVLNLSLIGTHKSPYLLFLSFSSPSFHAQVKITRHKTLICSPSIDASVASTHLPLITRHINHSFHRLIHPAVFKLDEDCLTMVSLVLQHRFKPHSTDPHRHSNLPAA